MLFGHQHTTAYGIGWSGDVDRSDVKSVTGSHAAIHGWDLGHIASNDDEQLMINAYDDGAVNTEEGHGEFVGREPYTATNKALSKWKQVTAPRKVERTGIPASGV